ncbi:MAG: TolC family protein, partial [Cyclobacteriaceae bacterium]
LELPTTPLPGEIFGEPGQTINAQFGRNYNYNAGFNASLNILDWPSALQTRIAKGNVVLAQVEAKAFEQALKEQVALYYYTAIVTLEALALNQKDWEISDSLRMLIQQKFQQGVIDAAILNQAKINLNNVMQSQNSNQVLLAQTWEQLRILLGASATDSLWLSQTLSHEISDYLIDPNVAPNPNILVAETQLDQASLQVKWQSTAFLPKISLYGYVGKQQFRDDFGLSFKGQSWSNYSYLGLNLNVPLFTGFANRNRLITAKIDHQIAENQRQDEVRKAAIQDQLLISEYQHRIDILTSALENYQLFDQNRALAYQKLSKGLISMDAYLMTFDDYLQAENAYLKALSTLFSTYSSIVSRQ